MDESLYTRALLGLAVTFSVMVLIALRQAGATMATLSLVAAVFALWLASAYALLANGFFGATGAPQLAFSLGVVLPTLAGYLAVRFWRPLRETVETMSTSSFLLLQHMRAAFGIMFFLTAALPLWFQSIGGLGDIAAGMAAFLALRHLHTKSGQPGAGQERRAILGGNLIGILDFLVVLPLGVFVVLEDQSPDIMFDLIPLYVVPIFLLLHVFSLQRLRTIALARAATGAS